MPSRPSILIINDDPVQRRDLVNCLKGVYRVDAPESRTELQSCLQGDLTRYSIVILDYLFEEFRPGGTPHNASEVMNILWPGNEDRPAIIFLTSHERDAAVIRLAAKYHLPIWAYATTTCTDLKRQVEIELARLNR